DQGSGKFFPLQHTSHTQTVVSEMGDYHIKILELLRKKNVESSRNLIPKEGRQFSQGRTQRCQATPPANRIVRQRLPIPRSVLLQGILVADNANLKTSLKKSIYLIQNESLGQ
ncbi:MAG: hypothetical protein AAAC48_24945, partial [Phyllobacterium sp.]|uniref:hypothetical protein n=1 Tax=Phyllobacterium sp. TaxID=1871046 RepID=UPI0030F294BE